MEFTIPIRPKHGGSSHDSNQSSLGAEGSDCQLTAPQSSAHRFQKPAGRLDKDIRDKLAQAKELQLAHKVSTLSIEDTSSEEAAPTVYQQSQWNAPKPIPASPTSRFNPFKILWGQFTYRSLSAKLNGNIFAVRSVDIETNAALKAMKDDIPVLTLAGHSFKTVIRLITQDPLDDDATGDIPAIYREACGHEHHPPVEGAPETISWHTILELGKEFLQLMEHYVGIVYLRLRETGPAFDAIPSQSQEQFSYRVAMWKWKKDVFETILEYADTKLSRKLDADSGEYTATRQLWNEQTCNGGIFRPYPETPETIKMYNRGGEPEHCKAMPFLESIAVLRLSRTYSFGGNAEDM